MEIVVFLVQLRCCLLHKEHKCIALKYQKKRLYVPTTCDFAFIQVQLASTEGPF